MAKAALVLSFISCFLGAQGSDDSDAMSLLQLNAKPETNTQLWLAPQGWSEARMEDSKTDDSKTRSGFFSNCGGILHHVTECTQCNIDFCASSLWQDNSGSAEAGYTDGSSVPIWGCSNVPANPYVIRNSGNGAIYVVEKGSEESAGTLHHVTSCDQCNVDFCDSSLWKENSGSAEDGYAVGSDVPSWGCDNVPTNPYVIRNSGSGAIYVMESAGTLHHVTTCNQCDVDFCASSLWKDNSGSAEDGYDVGSDVPSWGCDNVPANPYVIRNSGSGAIYVAEVCPATPTPATTTTTTVVSLDGLDDGMERAAETTDQQTNTHECKDWCYSKKHKDKDWQGQKCEWFACSSCSECSTA